MVKGAAVSAKQPFSRDVGRRLGQDLVRKLGDKPHACWLFCQPGDGLEDLVAGVAEAAGTDKLVGCTTDGEISSDGFSIRSAVLGGIVSDRIRFEVASSSGLKADSEAAGRRLGIQLPADARHIQLLSDGLTGNGCALLRGVHSVFGPRVAVSGGTAGDARQFKQTWQFIGKRIVSDAAVGISFSGDFKVGTGVRSGWFPAGAPKKVTRASGNVVYELDGQSALSVYRQYLRGLANQLPAVGVQFPFGIVDDALSLGEDPILRAPMSVNEMDGSVTFAGEIPQASTIVLTTGGSMRSLLDASADAARRAMADMQGTSAGMIFFYSCMARKMLLGARASEEKDRVCSAVGTGIPIIGFYTYGEFCPSVGGTECKLHNETATVTVVGT